MIARVGNGLETVNFLQLGSSANNYSNMERHPSQRLYYSYIDGRDILCMHTLMCPLCVAAKLHIIGGGSEALALRI